MRSISGRTDVDYVSVVEVFDNLSHGEIHSAVRQLDPAALAGAAQTFLTAATGLGDGVEIAHGEIRAAIADGWRGAAAQQASDAVRDFEQTGRRIADVLTAVGVRLSQAGDAAESIRTAIAEPAGAQPDPAAALLDSEQAATNATLTREAENARLDAVQAMETIYAGAFLPTGSGVPAFTGITTDTGTTAAGVAPSGTVPSAGMPQAAMPGVVASTTAPATIAATAPAGSAPVVSSAGTTATSNGVVSTSGNATAPAGSTPGTTPATTTATTTPAAVAGPGRPVTDSAKKASTAPASITPATSSAFPGKVSASSRPRPAADTATASATGQVADASAGNDGRQEPTVTGGEAAAGMGAGAVGGMMGGAIAAADQARPSGGPRPAQPVDEPEDEDDEFLRFLEEEPTYLEPADEVNALIGKLDPTSPAVLGEWTERE
ncbi:WXG100 family type VII secretion target [Nocardia salmonicida]|uniref:WXG100 family type VII secretion target n=1 Tax=Nocardia salmonicida TaxID=53431 RepID=UPI0033D4F875